MREIKIPAEWIEAIEKEPDILQKENEEKVIEFIKKYYGKKSLRAMEKACGFSRSFINARIDKLIQKGELK